MAGGETVFVAPGEVLDDIGQRVDEPGELALQGMEFVGVEVTEEEAVMHPLPHRRHGPLDPAQATRVGDVVGD